MDYYVLSLKYSPSPQFAMLVWWRPDSAGYTIDLNQAGRYTEKQIQEQGSYLNNGESTLAVPCDTVDNRETFRVVECGSTLAGDIYRLKDELRVINGGKSNRKAHAQHA